MDDAVEALVCAIDHPEVVGGVINIGSGHEVRICDLVEKLHSLVKGSLPPRLGALPYRDGEMWRLYVDPSTARELLGFEARTSVEEGLRRTVEASLGEVPCA